jgi:hypothetical protein
VAIVIVIVMVKVMMKMKVMMVAMVKEMIMEMVIAKALMVMTMLTFAAIRIVSYVFTPLLRLDEDAVALSESAMGNEVTSAADLCFTFVVVCCCCCVSLETSFVWNLVGVLFLKQYFQRGDQILRQLQSLSRFYQDAAAACCRLLPLAAAAASVSAFFCCFCSFCCCF